MFGDGNQTYGSAGGGGGFMTSPGKSPGGGGNLQSTKTLRPVTIRQLVNAQQVDENFQVDGVDIVQVTIVGFIASVVSRETFSIYRVDDGTGQIDCKVWLDHDENGYTTRHLSEWREGVYPLEDMNELTFHFVECVSVRRALLQKKEEKAQASSSQQFGTGIGGQPMNMAKQSGFGDGGYGGAYNPGAQRDPIQRDLLNLLIQRESTEDGASFQEIISTVTARGHTTEQVRDTLFYLMEEGQVYSTIDDNHFKTTVESVS